MGAFGFHWVFVDEMMPIDECLSVNCVYSFPQVVSQQINNISKIALMAILLVLVLPLTVLLDSRFSKISGQMFLKWKIGGFCRKLLSWLKILEKRDPQTVLIAARI